MESAERKEKIFYVYDALCGWCYGFSPVMEQLHRKYSQQFDFEIISGGMIVGERVGPIGEVAPYIKQAYQQVEKITGMTFGKSFLEGVLEEGSTIFSSMASSIALSIVKERFPEKGIEFGAALQKAIYFDGVAPTDEKALAQLAIGFGFESAVFLQAMRDQKYEQMAIVDFERTAELKVNGFPTVIATMGEKLIPLTKGYMSFEHLDSNLQQALTETPTNE